MAVREEIEQRGPDGVPLRAPGRVRAGIGRSLDRLAKVFGHSEPAAVAVAEAEAGMTPSRPFSPGEPIGPYDGFNRTPRSWDFTPNYNVATRPRTHEHVSFDALRSLIEAYDIAQICLYHRIDSIRSLEWSLVAMDGYEGDVTDAVNLALAVLRAPDGETPFDAWLAEWVYDILAFDAGCLYRMRNRLGQVVGLRTVDGTTLAPLVDYWGNPPKAPAEAFVQYVNGLPWNWLTTNDVIYRPFRKRTNSPYGRAPLESVILNANTDLRFQAYFLQHFTEGNIPAAFAAAPESWSPQQIEQFQEYWDAWLRGDQAAKAQVKWMPGGSKIDFVGQRDFSDQFSLFMMRKTAAAYHVVPTDLGFTESVNKSSGETQTDVQHRIGDVPLAKHLASILTRFLQDDLHLPIKFQFDFGEEQDDRRQTAEADQIYIQNAVVSPSEIRELRYGLTEPAGRKVPRYIFSTRSGAVPLSALFAVAGQIDPASAAPAPGAALPHRPFSPVPGVEANPAPPTKPLAVQIYGEQVETPALPPGSAPPALTPAAGHTAAPASHVTSAERLEPVPAPALAKDGGAAPAGAPTAGISAATGLYSYDLAGHATRTPGHDDEDEQDAPGVGQLAKAELAAYRRYLKGRRRAGRWKDFEFDALDAATAHRLNDAGRLAVRKAAGQVAVAGLALHAADTGRILMIQRGIDPGDPAAGLWEAPGGHLEDGESAFAAAAREWQEETGLLLGADLLATGPAASWTSGDGVYQGFVLCVPSEQAAPVEVRGQVVNPDDPDGDQVEAIAWWNPALLPGNPAVRIELRADADQVLHALERAGDLAKAAGERLVAAPGTVPGLTKRSGMISLDVPGVIPPVPGGVTDHHVTIVYLGKDIDDAAFAEACERAQAAAAAMPGPLTGSIGGIGTFAPSAGSDWKTPVYAGVVLPGIERLREALEDLSASEHATYTPHMTLAYLEPGQALPAASLSTPVTVTHVSVHRGQQVVRFPLGPGGDVEKATGGAPPKAPAGPGSDTWPGWDHDQHTADHYATQITAALAAALTLAQARELARRWRGHAPAGEGTRAERRAMAQEFLAAQGPSLEAPLAPILEQIHVDGYYLGTTAGAAVLDDEPMDLGAWQPGQTEATRARVEDSGHGGGLALFLAGTAVVLAGIVATRIARMASALASSPQDASETETATAVRDALTDESAADGIAITELSTAMGAGAEAAYTARGVRMRRWVTEGDRKVCAACLGNAAQGPVPIGEAFDSGAHRPPAHSRCRCAVVPA